MGRFKVTRSIDFSEEPFMMIDDCDGRFRKGQRILKRSTKTTAVVIQKGGWETLEISGEDTDDDMLPED
jgi:hypothetical protein